MISDELRILEAIRIAQDIPAPGHSRRPSSASAWSGLCSTGSGSRAARSPPLFFKNGAPTPGELVRAFARRPRTAAALMRFGLRTIAPVTKLFEQGEDERAMVRFVHGMLGREVYESLPEERRQQMRANLSEMAAEFRINNGFASFTEDDARAIRVPTLALTGAKSPAVLVYLSERLLELLPDARRIVVPAASHVMHEENAPATNAAILAFLSEQRVQAAA